MSFTLYEAVEISRGSRTAKIDFINPSSDANKIVVELQVVGSSGERTTVGSSKAVLPGYSISTIPITNPTALTGSETKGYIVLVPYDNVTEEKKVVRTELPVTIRYAD